VCISQPIRIDVTIWFYAEVGISSTCYLHCVEDPEIPQKISTMEESNFTSFSRWSPSSYMGIAPQGNTLHPIMIDSLL
jgi:hypothetical protein